MFTARLNALKATRIRKHEVGLWFRHGDLHRVLGPGVYRIWTRVIGLGFDRVEVYDTLDTLLQHKLLDVLLADETLAGLLEVVDLTDTERALVWVDGRLGWVLGRGRYAFWKSPRKLLVERYDAEQFTFTHRKVESVIESAAASRYFEAVRVESHERVMLFRDGKLAAELGAGLHVFWKGAGQVRWTAVDLREQTIDVAGQEIMTADKVTLRVNLVVAYQVTDPLKAVSEVTDWSQALYREAQLALRGAVGERPLDKLLADKEATGSEVRGALRARAAEFGVAVRSVGLRDIILPGEMKSILNQVIEATKRAEANLIRRREETAAARSQANTAKLLADNPALARMKELETLAEVLAGTKAHFIFGPGDLTGQIKQLVAQDNPTHPESGP